MGFFTLASTASPVAPEGVLEADTWKTSLQLEYYLKSVTICTRLYTIQYLWWVDRVDRIAEPAGDAGRRLVGCKLLLEAAV